MIFRRANRLVAWLRESLAASGSPPDAGAARPCLPRVEELEGRDLPAVGLREQYALDLINRMRASPYLELPRLLNSGDPDVNAALDSFHVDRNLLQQQWRAFSSEPPLAWSDLLAGTALAHSQLMYQLGAQQHQLPGEPDFKTRLLRARYPDVAAGENIFAYGKNVFQTHAAYALDWGAGPGGIQSPAGHRDNIMDPTYTEVGIGLVDAPAGASTGPLLSTQDFGSAGAGWFLGVVYRDLNGNGVYDLGEGVPDVTVSLDRGGSIHDTDRTNLGGGYQIREFEGHYTATLSGGGLPGPVSQPVYVFSSNTLFDVNLQTLTQIQLGASEFLAPENGGAIAITLARGGDLSGATSVRVYTIDGSARAGTDCTAVSTRVNFAPNESLQTVTIPIINNALPDRDRTLRVFLSDGGSPATFFGARDHGTVTILDDDAPGEIGFASAAFSASEDAGSATITVSRRNGTLGAVTVSYRTEDGTAKDGQDYTPVSGTVAFVDGQSSQTFTVPLVNDTILRLPVHLGVGLSEPAGGATLGSTASAILNIVDDLFAVPDSSPPANLVGAAAAFARSREFYQGFAMAAYRRYLARTPDGGGLDYWVARLQGGLAQESLEANFIGSPEYIDGHGGSGAGWVRGMYKSLLGRDVSREEVDYWVGRLVAGVTTSQVAFGFAASAEREGQRVRDNYRSYLGRDAGNAEARAWVDTFLRGFSNEDLVAGFLASDEYYRNAAKGGGNATIWLLSVYRDVLARAPHDAEAENWLRYFGLRR